jgi:hypothetical protein
MDYNNKKISLDDGKTYIVIEQVNIDENVYLYIANSENEEDTSFIEIRGNEILSIDPDIFNEKVFPLFKEKLMK